MNSQKGEQKAMELQCHTAGITLTSRTLLYAPVKQVVCSSL